MKLSPEIKEILKADMYGACSKDKYNMLKIKQNLSLDDKVVLTKIRIKEWYEKFNGNICVSFSGGKDSTVLLTLVRELYPEVPGLFSNTGVEFPEINQFVRRHKGIIHIRPKYTYKYVTENYGWPVISKVQATSLRKCREQNLSEKYRNKLMHGDEKGYAGKISEKNKFLLNAPFKISEKCCDHLKKKPFDRFFQEEKLYPMSGEMAEEGGTSRLFSYLEYGCNGFGMKIPRSRPLGFWTNDDIWGYLMSTNTDYCKLYDQGEDRTGCIYCLFGVKPHQEGNRIQRLKNTHPKHFKFFMEKLGGKQVMDYMEIPY